jgi:transketolase
MFRAIHDSTVLVTSDANQTAALVDEMVDRPGVVYLRTLRMATPVIYTPGERFPIGGSRTVRAAQHDDVTVLAAGITVHEALAAADILAEKGIRARVIDLYSVKPIDAETLLAAAAVTNGRLVVAEDHHPEGGLGSAVTEALLGAGPQTLRVTHLAVRDMPGSGTGEELMAAAGIDAKHIDAAARSLLNAQ